MRIIAFVTDASALRDILAHLGEPMAPTRIAPARGPPPWAAAGSEHDPAARSGGPSQTGLRVRPAPHLIHARLSATRGLLQTALRLVRPADIAGCIEIGGSLSVGNSAIFNHGLPIDPPLKWGSRRNHRTGESAGSREDVRQARTDRPPSGTRRPGHPRQAGWLPLSQAGGSGDAGAFSFRKFSYNRPAWLLATSHFGMGVPCNSQAADLLTSSSPRPSVASIIPAPGNSRKR